MQKKTSLKSTFPKSRTCCSSRAGRTCKSTKAFAGLGSVERDGVVCQSSVTFGSIGTVTTWKKHKWSQSVRKMALRSGLQSQSQYYQQLVGGGSGRGRRGGPTGQIPKKYFEMAFDF